MDKKIKILGIAPYESLKTLMLKAASNHTEVIMDCYIGDMNDGVEIAKRYENEGYDVIISRGAVAQLIKDVVKIPVMAVAFSAYDLLRTIKLAENYPYQYAIVGFPELAQQGRTLSSLLQKEIEVITVYHEEDAEKVIRDLKFRGVRMIICGTLGAYYAEQMGLSSILVTSGEEAVEQAISQAIKLSQGYSYMKERKNVYEQILRNDGSKYFVLIDQEGGICFSTWDRTRGDLEEMLASEYADIPDEGMTRVETLQTGTVRIKAEILRERENRYVLFRIYEEKMPVGSRQEGLRFSDRKQAERYYCNSFFGASGALGAMEKEIQRLEKTKRPVLIIGEAGSGKDMLARYLYIHSSLCSRPLAIIDCEILSNQTWSYLMTNEGSPFAGSYQTVYIRNINTLSEHKCRQLQSMMTEREFLQTNQVIIACESAAGGKITDILRKMINQGSYQSILMPPLRERIEELQMLSGLYMAKMCTELSKQVLGFEPGAIDLMKSYDWPGNFSQLKRILEELIASTEGFYISRRDVERALNRERTMAMGSSADGFDLNRTLEEMNADIIRRKVEQCGGNQAAAARALGISRTTLWRCLKKLE